MHLVARTLLLTLALVSTVAFSAAEPPLRLTTTALENEPCESARSGSLDAYFVRLDAALHETLDGKTPTVAIKRVTGDAGALALLQWRLLSRLDAASRTAINASHAESMCWLLTHREPLELLLDSGDIEGNRWSEATRILCEILDRDPSARAGIGLRIAAATALVFATPVPAMASGANIDPFDRYAAFKQWDSDGVLFQSFRDLSTWELRYVVGSWSTNEDLVWARANIKPELKQRDRVGDGAHMLAYNLVNKNGVSVQEGGKFYDNKPMTLAIMLEYGGVCGAVSRFGTSMSQAFGVPAMPVGQPGHCAFLWQKEPHTWSINNDISGWAESGCHSGIHMTWGSQAWFIPLMQQAQDSGGWREAEALRACASFAVGNARTAILAEACAKCPQDFAAWQERVAEMGKDSMGNTSAQWKDLMKQMASGLAKHPMAFGALLATAEPALVQANATPSARKSFATKYARVLAVMASNGADAGLISYAHRNLLVMEAEAIAPKDKQAARALVSGMDAKSAVLSPELASDIIDMALASTNALDVAPTGSAHSAWSAAMQRLISGIAWQPPLRKDGLRRVQRIIASLMKSNRAADGRGLADFMVQAAKATQDPKFEAEAVAYRGTLQ